MLYGYNILGFVVPTLPSEGDLFALRARSVGLVPRQAVAGALPVCKGSRPDKQRR